MSTMISNAFRLPGGIETLQTVRQLVAEHAETTGNDIVARRMAEIATAAADRNAFGFEEYRAKYLTSNPYEYARDRLTTADRLRLASKAIGSSEGPLLRDVVEYECVVIPCKDDVLMMSCFWQDEWRELNDSIIAECKGEEFSYWNNTDRPKEISEADWEERYRRWEEALSPFCWIPARAGFAIKAINSFIPRPSPDDIQAFIPPIETRAKGVAEILADRKWMKMIETSGFQVSQFTAWKFSDEAKASVATIAAEVIDELPELNSFTEEWPEKKNPAVIRVL